MFVSALWSLIVGMHSASGQCACTLGVYSVRVHWACTVCLYSVLVQCMYIDD